MSEDSKYILVHQNIKYSKEILTPECLKFLGELHKNFNAERKARLLERE
jgi:hypothetical protein